MLNSAKYRIGHWTFSPSAHELRSGKTTVRLQQRASATLSLLCERAGEVVSQEEIIDRAWGRRHLSPNSVAIVIGDLRRALGIAAGEPGSIETLPKAGYRLIATKQPGPPPPRAKALYLAGAIGALILVAALAAWLALGRSSGPAIAVGSVTNDMGSNRYAALMRASGETVLLSLGRQPGDLRIIETPAPSNPNADYVLQQRWVLWSGDPELVLVARDHAGNTIWSGAIYGPENQFPAKISDRVGQFAAYARSHRPRG
jgi:DNA-binding winged helix-turn-helix (wHTH) protein